MLTDINIGQHIPGDSIVHRLDPRIKLISTMMAIIVLFLISSFTGFLIYFIFFAAIVLLAEIPFIRILRGLKPILILMLITLFFHAFFTEGGAILWEWRFLRIEEEGLLRGLFMIVRIILLIMYTSVLTLTTSPMDLTDGIEYILKPFRRIGVPAGELAMMMTIALRFIPTLLNEADKIIKAQKSRGADFESGNLIRRAKNLVPLLVPLFISAFRRADELALAMEARCYRGGRGRTRLHELQMQKKDVLALLFMLTSGLLIAIYF